MHHDRYYGHATDIVAYTYRADIYCPSCIVDEMTSRPDFDGWALAEGVPAMSTESNLDEIAQAFGIERYNEYTFDSDEFPKVVFRSSIEEGEYCGRCHEPIDD